MNRELYLTLGQDYVEDSTVMQKIKFLAFSVIDSETTLVSQDLKLLIENNFETIICKNKISIFHSDLANVENIERVLSLLTYL